MKTKIFRARANSPSMKGTIPLSIVEALKLEHGDEIDWQIEVRNGKIVAVMEKVNSL